MKKSVKWAALIIWTLLVFGLGGAMAGSPSDQERPTPTSTPEIARPTQNASQDQEYLTEVEAINESLKTNMALVSVIAINPSKVLTDPQTKFSVAGGMNGIVAAHERAKLLNPPPQYVEANHEFVSALGMYAEAMDVLTVAIDQSDSAKIVEAGDLLTRGAERMKQAARLIEQAQ